MQLRLAALSATGISVDARCLGTRFRQPIFGANNLGAVHPMAGTMSEDIQLTVYPEMAEREPLPLFIDAVSQSGDGGRRAGCELVRAARPRRQQYVDDRLSTAYLDPHDHAIVVEDDKVQIEEECAELQTRVSSSAPLATSPLPLDTLLGVLW